MEVDARTNDGMTPSHTAALYGRLEVVQVLVDDGADIGAWGNGQGGTALKISRKQGL